MSTDVATPPTSDVPSPGVQWSTQLTAREREVIALLAQGLEYSEVALTLVISPFTVKTHVHNIYVKLGARSCGHAVYLLLTGQDNASAV